ncbi:MAG: hypothetical protein KBC62_03260 [Candidatus Pacebacteria bacterium]|nr:hypothetical protein [Candidatus Paceibacterota bacterium]MBP9842998.1 hypothetical protein [Candidatus Paceibacterota bacterium]
MTDTKTEPSAQPEGAESATKTDIMTKVSHLTLIVSERANGKDIVSSPTAEGGILLNNDERDELIDLLVTAEEEIVPEFYDHCWPAFIADYTQVIVSATTDYLESGGQTDIIDDVRHWFATIRADGKPMISPKHITLFPVLAQKAA